jgi:hypothetical protein
MQKKADGLRVGWGWKEKGGYRKKEEQTDKQVGPESEKDSTLEFKFHVKI